MTIFTAFMYGVAALVIAVILSVNTFMDLHTPNKKYSKKESSCFYTISVCLAVIGTVFIVTAKNTDKTILYTCNQVAETNDNLEKLNLDIDGVYIKNGLVSTLSGREFNYYSKYRNDIYVYADWVTEPTIYNNKVENGFIKEEQNVLVLPLEMRDKLEDKIFEAELVNAVRIY